MGKMLKHKVQTILIGIRASTVFLFFLDSKLNPIDFF